MSCARSTSSRTRGQLSRRIGNSFASGCTGISYGFSFARGGRLRAEVYLDTGDGDENGRLFDLLEAERGAIEAAFGEELEWERLDGRRASRIARYDEGSISDAEDVLERHRAWAVEKLIKMKKVMQPRLVVATGG